VRREHADRQRSLSDGVVRGAGRTADGGAVDGIASRRRRRRRRLVHVLVDGATTRVHEEVNDRRHLETELLGDRRLDLLARTLYLLEDGDQRAPLDLGEHHARLLGGSRGRARRGLLTAAVGRTVLLRRDRLRSVQQRPVSTALARCPDTQAPINSAPFVIVYVILSYSPP